MLDYGENLKPRDGKHAMRNAQQDRTVFVIDAFASPACLLDFPISQAMFVLQCSLLFTFCPSNTPFSLPFTHVKLNKNPSERALAMALIHRLAYNDLWTCFPGPVTAKSKALNICCTTICSYWLTIQCLFSLIWVAWCKSHMSRGLILTLNIKEFSHFYPLKLTLMKIMRQMVSTAHSL